jgi:outer membrane protein assembly factor BamB
MTVIELGDLGSGEKEQAHAPVHFDRRLIRRVGVAVAAVLCVLGVTSSAPVPEPRGLRVLWSMPLDQREQTVVTATSVYTAITETTRMLTARNLDDGAVRWQRRLPAPMQGVEAFEQAGVLLVPAKRQSTGRDGVDYNEFTTETVALDPGTGAELWRHPGAVSFVAADTALFTELSPSGRFMSSVSVVRLRDGSVVWGRPVADVERLTTDDPGPLGPERIITVTPAGQVEVLRYADGTRLAGGRVEWPVRRGYVDGYNELRSWGGRLFVGLVGTTEATVVGYDADTLRRLWRVEHLEPGGTTRCGTAVCGLAPDGLVALDGGTGQVRWRNEELQTAWPISAERLVSDATDATPQLLLDAETGRTVADLGSGFMVPDVTGTTAYFLRLTRAPAGFTSISRLDLPTGRTAVRGQLDRIDGGGCTAAGDRLVCPTPTGRMMIMAVG